MSSQDELSDVSQGVSKSATPASTTASDVAMAAVDTPPKEEAEGLSKNLNTRSRKPDSSKNIDVQAAPGTNSVSIGERLARGVPGDGGPASNPPGCSAASHHHHMRDEREDQASF